MTRLHAMLCAACLSAALLTGCGAGEPAAAPDPTPAASPVATRDPTALPQQSTPEEENNMKMTVTVNGTEFTATLADTDAAAALAEWMRDEPVTVQMSDYAGFEKVGPLGDSLPADDRQTTTTAGDIVLYQGDQVVIFYGSNSWSYTSLGRVDDLTGWAEALGSGDVTAVFSLAE